MSFRAHLRVVSKLGLLTILPGLIVSSPISGLFNSVRENAFAAFAATRPSVLFVDVSAGPVRGGPNDLGVPISIFGKGFGSTRGTSRVTIGGVEVASYLIWGSQNAHNRTLDMIVVQPGAAVSGGAIIVTVDGIASNSDFVFTPNLGSIYYISPSGSDSNPCSDAAPCQTIQHSLGSVAQPGDTILVRGGSYAEGEIWIQRATGQSGTEAQPKTLKNYPGEEAYFTNNGRPFYLDADYITISGLNFQNSKALGIPDRVMVGNKIINMTFTGPGVTNAAPVQTHGNNHLVAGNVCEETGNGDTASHCYYISRGDNIKILYNVGSGATGYQLQIYEETRNVPDLQRIISNVLVEGNIFRNSRARAGIIIAIRDSGGYGNYIDGVTIRNNVIYNNAGYGIIENLYDIRNVRIYNNTLYQNGSTAIYIANSTSESGVDIRNNVIYQASQISAGSSIRSLSINTNYYYPTPVSIVGASDPNPITGSVQFANPGAFDFHLQAGSAAIDRGLSLAGVTADFDAVPRPQGNAYDLGAFEYPSGATPAISVTVTPATANLGPGGTQQFTASVTGTTNTAVTWSLSPAVGTISPNGFYTAPGTISAQQTVVVTATSQADRSRSASATVIVSPQAPVLMAVVNASNYAPAPLAAGTLVSLFGFNLGPQTPTGAVVVGGRVSTTVAAVTAYFDDTPAPLLWVQSGQLNAVVPFSVAGKTSVRVEVDFAGRRSNPMQVSVAPTTPGIFTSDMSGLGQAAALNEDGTLNSSSRPARRLSIVVLYVTGLGQTQPAGVDGLVATSVLPRPVYPVTVEISGIQAETTYVGAAPYTVAGVFQINARVPAGAISGAAVPIIVRAAGSPSQLGVTIAIE